MKCTSIGGLIGHQGTRCCQRVQHAWARQCSTVGVFRGARGLLTTLLWVGGLVPVVLLTTGACHNRGQSQAKDAGLAEVQATTAPAGAAAPGTAAPGTAAAASSAKPPAGQEPTATEKTAVKPAALGGAPLVALDVEGFEPAAVSVPLGAKAPRPVVLALHGNYDRPEWQCQVWRDVVGPEPWILCPRGVPRSDAPKQLDRWTYAGEKKLEQELDAAVAALVAAYPEYVDAAWPVFTGFSLGAILGVRLISKKDAKLRFRAAVLVEGGYKGWHSASAKAFAAQGGERVLFACGQSACRHAAKQASQILSRHEVVAEVASGGDVGHTYDGSVAAAIRDKWRFVVGRDARFGMAPDADSQHSGGAVHPPE